MSRHQAATSEGMWRTESGDDDEGSSQGEVEEEEEDEEEDYEEEEYGRGKKKGGKRQGGGKAHHSPSRAGKSQQTQSTMKDAKNRHSEQLELHLEYIGADNINNKTTNRQQKPISKSVKWTEEESRRLKDVVEAERKNGAGLWPRVAQQFPGKTSKHCRERWRCVVDPDINRSEWTIEEDEKVMRLHQEFGTRWSRISKELRGRPELSVKTRCISIERAKRRFWTADEDAILILFHNLFGPEWRLIGKFLPTRKNNAIRARLKAIQSNTHRLPPSPGDPLQAIPFPSAEEVEKARNKAILIAQENFPEARLAPFLEQGANYGAGLPFAIQRVASSKRLQTSRASSSPRGLSSDEASGLIAKGLDTTVDSSGEHVPSTNGMKRRSMKRGRTEDDATTTVATAAPDYRFDQAANSAQSQYALQGSSSFDIQDPGFLLASLDLPNQQHSGLGMVADASKLINKRALLLADTSASSTSIAAPVKKSTRMDMVMNHLGGGATAGGGGVGGGLQPHSTFVDAGISFDPSMMGYPSVYSHPEQFRGYKNDRQGMQQHHQQQQQQQQQQQNMAMSHPSMMWAPQPQPQSYAPGYPPDMIAAMMMMSSSTPPPGMNVGQGPRRTNVGYSPGTPSMNGIPNEPNNNGQKNGSRTQPSFKFEAGQNYVVKN